MLFVYVVIVSYYSLVGRSTCCWDRKIVILSKNALMKAILHAFLHSYWSDTEQ